MDISRYSFLCQKALHQGLQYARSFGDSVLEVEHVALAMLRSDAAQISQEQNEKLQEILRQKLGETQKVFGSVQVQFGPRLDQALDAAEAKAGSALIEHELLWECLLKVSESIQEFLGQGGSSKAKQTKNEVDKKVSANKIESAPKSKNDGYKISEKLDKVLKQFTTDLTAMAERNELDPVMGRDQEVRRVLEILGRKKKNNPVLIGEAGVGKTAIAELLAIKIVEGRVPESLSGKRVLSLDIAGLVAGARYRGEFEERLKDLIAAIKACQGQIILFIDEIHLIAGAGASDGAVDAANLMKPALARGELRCLGATTFREYREYIEKDPALERRFQPVKVGEPTREVTIGILRGLKDMYEVHHGVQIDDEALIASVDLSIRYLPSRRLPDKAIDLLDEACSKLRLEIESYPNFMESLRSQITQFEIEKKALGNDNKSTKAREVLDNKLKKTKEEFAALEQIWRNQQFLLDAIRKSQSRRQELLALFENTKAKGDFDFAARLQYSELPKLEEKIAASEGNIKELQKMHPWLSQVVGEREIAAVITAWTGIPFDRLLKDANKSVLQVEERLEKRVFGQKQALNVLGAAIKRAQVGVQDPDRPLGVFLFLGPSGVGKTETAKALAEEIFADENKMLRIDMSEYMEAHSTSRLIGSPPGYVGFGEGGQLSEPVRQNPYMVVLFDEIEKAHPRVLDLLLQIFDDGRLTDSQGRLINFRNTIVIMTSNLLVEQQNSTEDLEQNQQHLRERLATMLRPELIGRIDEVILFAGLGKKHFVSLFAKQVDLLNRRLLKKQIRVSIGEALEQAVLAKVNVMKFGARALKRVFQNMVTDQVALYLLDRGSNLQGAWRVDIDANGSYKWDIDSSSDFFLPEKAG